MKILITPLICSSDRCRILNSKLPEIENANKQHDRDKTARFNLFDVYLNSTTNKEIIKNALEKLYAIKLTVNELTVLEKLKKYIDAIIYVYKNDIYNYNLIIATLPPPGNTLNAITSTYTVDTALTDIVKLFTNTVSKIKSFNSYKLNAQYSIDNLNSIETLINSDYANKIITKTTQQTEYNTFITNNMSSMILKGINVEFKTNYIDLLIVNKLSSSFTITDVIRHINILNKLLNYYINSKINYTKALTNEIDSLTKLKQLIPEVENLFLNYCKQLIGISKTTDPQLLNNIPTVVQYPPD